MPTILPPLSSHSAHHYSSLTSLLNQCKTMSQFKQIHSKTIRTGHAHSRLIKLELFSFCSAQAWTDMAYAHQLFDDIPDPDIFQWNSLVHGYTIHNSPESAMFVYVDMVLKGYQPDKDTFAFLIKGFTRETSIVYGDEIHAHIVKLGFGSDFHVSRSLVRMYTLTEEIDLARELFDKCPKRDSTMWNSLICGYCKIEQFDESCSLFKQMVSQNKIPSLIAYIYVLSACIKIKDMELGVEIHRILSEKGILPNLKLENKLIEMYIQCGAIGNARRIFDGMKKRNKISWSLIIEGLAKFGQMNRAHKLFDQMPRKNSISYIAIINGYAKKNRLMKALEFFQRVQIGDITLDNLTMVNLLTACAELGAFEIGESLREYMNKTKSKMEISIANAFIDMYSKCGSISNALAMFDKMPQRDVNTWRVILNGLAINGQGESALNLFDKMLDSNKPPDEEIFASVLKACAYSGMIDEGRNLFISMISNYNIMPNVAHYWCMISLLGRAGRIKEAFETIKNMPMNPNYTIWGTFLGACRVIGSIEMGEFAFNKLVELDSNDGMAYLLLSNLYAKCDRWKNVAKIRSVIIKKGFNKEIFSSSIIEVKGKIHEFLAGDKHHELYGEIYAKLKQMEREMKSSGYLYKSEGSYYHTEKLALAFGLVSLNSRAKIRIVKNYRVCVDCHNEIKMVSRIYGREILVRDGMRFHHFKHGSCSCKDYW